MRPLYWLTLLLVVALSSCDSNRVHEENVDIPEYIWNLEFKPSFNVNITDTSLLYNIYVNVRHTQFYSNSNMWILITTQFPDGKQLKKRVELPLANKEGKWDGDCLGDICDIQIRIQENAFFNQLGNHAFRFEQIMRIDNLPFVMSMGLRVEKAGARETVSLKATER